MHRTWARRGRQPRVDTYGQRKTAHVFGAIALDDAKFVYRFAPVFNNSTFLAFLKQLVLRAGGRRVFLVIDNAPHHNLSAEGKEWLAANSAAISLHRLPAYSPEFMPMEGVWKKTRALTTHNRFYPSVAARDAALRQTFTRFQRKPSLVAPQVQRYV